MRTRRLAPSFAPSGAKTELHESMKACVSEPPHDSPPALRSVTPESVAEVRTGKEVDGVATPAASAPDRVMILNVEPGGCGADTARPASASTEPSRGRTTATPPSLPPSAAAAARCSPGRMVAWTERPRRRLTVATTRSPKRSCAPGVPARRSS